MIYVSNVSVLSSLSFELSTLLITLWTSPSLCYMVVFQWINTECILGLQEPLGFSRLSHSLTAVSSVCSFPQVLSLVLWFSHSVLSFDLGTKSKYSYCMLCNILPRKVLSSNQTLYLQWSIRVFTVSEMKTISNLIIIRMLPNEFCPKFRKKKTFWFQTILDFEIVDKELLYL